ncbi:PREDICTED: general transcriptional corepressor CYC8-like [Amphimedon queenslandica]|nr:PREDICTED: general transcriptional corepressor CYC8-like [Amphimedon queenslandica]|eukprot:XP_019856511.1 PREDICTED: general transcriptional corepressor CYC8-like [Amphimedon queenslandica]
MTGGGGGGGGGGQQQQGTGSQGAGIVPVQGGNALVPQQQPVVNPKTQGEQSQEGEQSQTQEGQQQQGGDALTVLAQQQQPGANEQTNGQQGEEEQEEQEQGQQNQRAQLQKGEQSQSQDEQQQEGDLQRKRGDQQEGERESQDQPEPLELQQPKGGQEDPVHVETMKGKEDKEQIDENSKLVSTESIASLLASPVAAFESNNETEVLDKPGSDSKDRIHSTGVKEATNYAGLVYYEKDHDAGDLVTFTSAKKLNALLEFIKNEYPQAKRGPYAYFRIASPDGYVELNLNAPQDEPFTGWSIKPHIKPCRLYQDDINNFGDKDYPLPPSCPISVYGSPDAVPTLNYSVPLEGVVRPLIFYIRRSLRTTNPTASSSNTIITEATASSTGSTGGASVPATVDVDKVKKIINDVLVSHYARLNDLKMSLSDLGSQLFASELISDEVRETRSMEKFIGEFKASFNFMDETSEVQDHCTKFLKSFIAVRGGYANAAKFLRKKWIEAIKTELGIDFILDI